jgi:hypothetical protein
MQKNRILMVIVIIQAIVLICGSMFLYMVLTDEENEVLLDKNLYYEPETYRGWHQKMDENSQSYVYIRNWIEWDKTFSMVPEYNESLRIIPDFANYTFIYVSWGWRSSSGYIIDITNITLSRNGTMSVYVTNSYPYDMVNPVMTFSAYFVRIPNQQLQGYNIEDVSFLLE